jgi:hypothetical protein
MSERYHQTGSLCSALVIASENWASLGLPNQEHGVAGAQ